MQGLGLLLLLVGVAAALGLVARSASTTPARPPVLHPDIKKRVEEFRSTVEREASRKWLTPSLVLAVIARETGGVNRRGAAGEAGLMQVSLVAWQDYQTENNDPDANPFPEALDSPDIGIRVGGWFLDRKIEDMRGNVYDGLRAYNCGTRGARENPTCGAAYAEWVIKTGEPAFRGIT